MRKNVFEGFENNAVENLAFVQGGYYYRDTYSNGSATANDEDLVTEPSDNQSDCGPGSCIDETWTDCQPLADISGSNSGATGTR